MKTSEVSNLKARVTQLRSTLYWIAYGRCDGDSARREAERAMALDDKMKANEDEMANKT